MSYGFNGGAFNELARYSSRCAEYVAKSALLRFGVIPDKKHDINSLSRQIRDNKPIIGPMWKNYVAFTDRMNGPSGNDQQGTYYTATKGDVSKATDSAFRTLHTVGLMDYLYKDIQGNANINGQQRRSFMEGFSENYDNLRQMDENFLTSMDELVKKNGGLEDTWKDHTLATLDYLISMHHSILKDFQKFNKRRKRRDKDKGQHI